MRDSTYREDSHPAVSREAAMSDSSQQQDFQLILQFSVETLS